MALLLATAIAGCGGSDETGATSSATSTTGATTGGGSGEGGKGGSGGIGGQGGGGGALPTCTDAVKNGAETDVDCGGGECPLCDAGAECALPTDCLSAVCEAGVCAAPSCSDGILNGAESDVDCGGDTCDGCVTGLVCNDGTDCGSGSCVAGLCADPTCMDAVHNGVETDVDCGGAECLPCGDGLACNDVIDCVSLVCTAGVCASRSCSDGVLNGTESDLDCGGAACPGCATGEVCAQGSDCASLVCNGGTCALPTCNDGVKNSLEADVDCGGGVCVPCATGATCTASSDCFDHVCAGGLCAAATCNDAVQNGAETDVDCGGGACATCAAGQVCSVASDCQTNLCTGGLCTCTDPLGPIDPLQAPTNLSLTKLYSDFQNKVISPLVMAYAPQFVLWSDGATKQRWIYLPPCTQINTNNMNGWDFPVGTRIWKEFSVGGVLAETRYMARWGGGANDWHFVSYRWANGAQQYPDPPRAPLAGASNIVGTHDIPTVAQCNQCHNTSSKVLGVSAIQLSHQGAGANMMTLSNAGLLTVPAAGGFVVPGNATEKAALGYMHANCGNCHFAGNPGYTFYMNLLTTDATVQGTYAYTTGVGQTSVFTSPNAPGVTLRIASGSPGQSMVAFRMGARGSSDQMPPIGTEVVDNTGLAAVSAWIASGP